MPTPQAVAAINTLLQFGDAGSPETFVTVANVGDIDGPSMTTESVDVTSHSTGQPWRQFFPTLHNPGDCPFPLFWVPNDVAHTTLLGIWDARTVGDWRIVCPSGAGAKTYNFTAFIQDWKASFKVGDVIRAMVTLKISGKIYF